MGDFWLCYLFRGEGPGKESKVLSFRVYYAHQIRTATLDRVSLGLLDVERSSPGLGLILIFVLVIEKLCDLEVAVAEKLSLPGTQGVGVCGLHISFTVFWSVGRVGMRFIGRHFLKAFFGAV